MRRCVGGDSGSSSDRDMCDRIAIMPDRVNDPAACNAERKKIKKKDGRRKRPPL